MRSSDHFWEQSESVHCEIYVLGNWAFVVMQTVNCECSLLAALQWIMHIICLAAAIGISEMEYECVNIICLTIQINVNTTHFGSIYFYF